MNNSFLRYPFLIPAALLLGSAPVYPQPHLVEKLSMLMAGSLKRPVDIFDLFWHAWPFLLLACRIFQDMKKKAGGGA